MRRVVVTPTFAAGLGVVVAAVLAYPMQTVFSYAAPSSGSSCKLHSCGLPPQAGGEPAAGAGQRLATPTPSATARATEEPGRSARSAAAGGGRPARAAAPVLRYRTVGSGQWGFDATIVITFRPGPAHPHWRLRFGYPAARILKVWAGKYLWHGVHSALVASWDWPGQASSARPLTVSIGVTGRPAPPRRCSFNGRPCHITVRYWRHQHRSPGIPGR